MIGKRQIIFRIFLILVPLLVGIIGFSMIYGWYVRVIRTGKIDGSTKDVSINYVLRDGNKSATNSLTYDIDNLTFFDIENEDETEFFNTMAVHLELTLQNKSNSDMKYTVTYKATKRIVTDESDNDISISYVAGYFETIDEHTTIKQLENNQSYTYVNDDEIFSATTGSNTYVLKAQNPNNDDEVTIDLYLIGVQEISSAKNTDFMYTESEEGVKSLIPYQFSITIKCEPKSDSEVTEVVETTTITTTTTD